MTYQCIIVDDEPIAHEVIKNHLQKISYLKIAADFYNAADAHNYLAHNPVDLMFLDIEMPAVNGIDFLKKLEQRPLTIFTTAFRNYALEGFELGVVDYLLKPISFERFERAVERAAEFIDLQLRPTSVNREIGNPGNFNIVIKTGAKKVMLDFRTISHAQGLNDFTILFTPEKRYVVKGSVKVLAQFLPQSHFLRVHKSFIVAKDRIKIVTKNKIEFDDLTIPIGRVYKQEVDHFLTSNNSCTAI